MLEPKLKSRLPRLMLTHMLMIITHVFKGLALSAARVQTKILMSRCNQVLMFERSIRAFSRLHTFLKVCVHPTFGGKDSVTHGASIGQYILRLSERSGMNF